MVLWYEISRFWENYVYKLCNLQLFFDFSIILKWFFSDFSMHFLLHWRKQPFHLHLTHFNILPDVLLVAMQDALILLLDKFLKIKLGCSLALAIPCAIPGSRNSLHIYHTFKCLIYESSNTARASQKNPTKYANRKPQNEIHCFKLNFIPTIKNSS